jgi:N-hydroxyarylamine O-acetyltransferase
VAAAAEVNTAVGAYLDRIGGRRPVRPDLASLRELHRAHLAVVPFENLDIHLGVPIRLGSPSVDKIVERRRGGFCYELNGAFGTLLDALGFDVTLLQARVHGVGGLGIPFDHLCLLVELDGARYLADVGFGACFELPLRFEVGVDQVDQAGTFRIDDAGDGWFDLFADDKPQYRFELVGRSLCEFEPGCAFHQSPESHFAKDIVVTLPTDHGRVTLAGTALIETIDGGRHETTLGAADVDQVLADRFGIVLPEDASARMLR